MKKLPITANRAAYLVILERYKIVDNFMIKLTQNTRSHTCLIQHAINDGKEVILFRPTIDYSHVAKAYVICDITYFDQCREEWFINGITDRLNELGYITSYNDDILTYKIKIFDPHLEQVDKCL